MLTLIRGMILREANQLIETILDLKPELKPERNSAFYGNAGSQIEGSFGGILPSKNIHRAGRST